MITTNLIICHLTRLLSCTSSEKVSNSRHTSDFEICLGVICSTCNSDSVGILLGKWIPVQTLDCRECGDK